MSFNTEHFVKTAASKLKRRPIATLAAGGTGLSAAAVVFLYATFGTKAEIDKLRTSQATQWQAYQKQTEQVNALRLEVSQLKGQNAAFEFVSYILMGKTNETKIDK